MHWNDINKLEPNEEKGYFWVKGGEVGNKPVLMRFNKYSQFGRTLKNKWQDMSSLDYKVTDTKWVRVHTPGLELNLLYKDYTTVFLDGRSVYILKTHTYCCSCDEFLSEVSYTIKYLDTGHVEHKVKEHRLSLCKED